MKRKSFLIKILCVCLVVVIAAAAVVVTLNKSDTASKIENSGFLKYSFNGGSGYKATFEENGQFSVIAPNGYAWTGGVNDERVQALSENASWQEYMKSCIAVTYFDSTLSVYQTQTVYSANTSVNVTAKMGTDSCEYNYVFSNIFVSVKVKIGFKNGILSVQIPADGIIENGAYKVQYIEVLPFFGAADHSNDGYIMYPDGSGALMEYDKLEQRAANKRTETLKIYGSSGISESNKVYLPVFGIKNNDNAFLAAVNTGSAECDINISPEGAVVALNRASFTMNYRYCYDVPESDISTANTSGTSTKVDSQLNAQDFEALYFFLSDNNANYSGMASIYREFLLENKLMNTSNEKNALSLGMLMGESEELAFTTKSVVTTTFSQAEAILKQLKGEGASDIDVALIGWEKNGATANVCGFKPWNKLGSKKEFNSLLATAAENNINMLLQKNFYSAEKTSTGFSAKNDSVYEGNGFIHTNEFNSKFILNRTSSAKWFELYFKNAKKHSVGTRFLQFGENLTSDYSSQNRSSRTMSAESMSNILADASSSGKVAVEGANLYTLKYADTLFNIPQASSSISVCDRNIPFIQMVCYGSVSYTGEAVNLYYDSKKQLLKMLEYGYVPYFELTENGSSALKYTNSNELVSSKFSLWRDSLVETYKLSSELSSIRNVYMTYHESDGEHARVVYSNNSAMYLNFSDSVWDIGGKTVAAGGYMLIDSMGNVIAEGGKAS